MFGTYDERCFSRIQIGAVIRPKDDSRISVLYVDDERIASKVTKEFLELQGEFELDTVCSVQCAYEKMKERTYDAIVSDYHMPEKDGLQFLKELRGTGNGIPFILFTGKGREEVAAKALNLGADNYVSKNGDAEVVCTELAHDIRISVERARAMKAVLESEERYRSLLENIDEIIFAVDARGNLTYVSPSVERITGFAPDSIVGEPILGFFTTEEKVIVRSNFTRMLEGETFRTLEAVISRKDGTRAYFEMNAYPVFLSGKIVGIHGIARDITERKKKEKELRESERKYRTIFEGSNDGIIAVAPSTHGFVFANPAICRLTGYSEEELLKLKVEDLHPKETLPFVLKQLETVSQGKNSRAEAIPVLRKDRRLIYCHINASTLKTDKQNLAVAFFRDVTENKKAEETLQESEERFRAIFEGANDGILVADVKTKRFFFANPRIREISGYSLEELLRLGVSDIHPEKDLAYVTESFAKLVQGKLSLAKDIPVLRKDGRVVYCDVSARSVKIGSQECLVGLFRDVTERKKAAEKLKESEERFRAIFEGANDGILAADVKTKRFSFANPRICEITGYSLEELLRLGVGDINPKKDLPYVNDSFENQRQGKVALSKDIPVLRKDGRMVYCDVSSKYLKIGSQEYLVGIFRDVTESRKAEEKIRLLSNVVQQASEGIAVSDLHGKILFTNSAWLKIHGFGEDEENKLLGKMVGTFYCGQQAESIDRTVQSAGIFRGRITQVRKDGTTFPALATVSPLRNEKGQIIGTIRMAKNLREIVRDIRDVRSPNIQCLEKKETEGTKT